MRGMGPRWEWSIRSLSTRRSQTPRPVGMLWEKGQSSVDSSQAVIPLASAPHTAASSKSSSLKSKGLTPHLDSLFQPAVSLWYKKPKVLIANTDSLGHLKIKENVRWRGCFCPKKIEAELRQTLSEGDLDYTLRLLFFAISSAVPVDIRYPKIVLFV